MAALRKYTLLAALLVPAAMFGRIREPQELSAAETAVDTVIMVENIRVTAIKQGNTFGHQPVSATVLNAELIERQRITALKEASLTVPNFYIPDYGSRMTSSIYVRGLGARIDQPVVGMNIDNVPLMNKDAYDFDLYDIERIEVLRGPQSTLYGRNTIGGVINIYTLSPLAYRGIRAGVEYATANSLRARLSAYEQFGEKFGLSAAVNYGRSDGFFRNLYDNSHCGAEMSGSGRIKLQWKPDNRLNIENAFSASYSHQNGYPYTYAGDEPLKDAAGNTVIGKGEIRYNDQCGYERTAINDGLTLRYDGDGYSIASITSWQYLDDKMDLDQDFTPLSYFTLTQQRREHSLTEELMVRSTGPDRRYDWLCGAFGFYKSTSMHAPVTFKETGIEDLIVKNAERSGLTPYFTSDELLFDSNFKIASAGAALYHESTVHIGAFDITAGLRFDFEHAKMRYNCTSDAEGEFGKTHITPFTNKGSLKKIFFEVLPKLSAVWHINARNSMYVSVSKGYKAGGFNTQMFSEVLQTLLMEQMHVYPDREFTIDEVVAYEPEHSWNFELGAHTATADGRLTADVSLFYIDCRNQQLTVFPEGQTTGRMMTNAGKSRSFGVEISSRILPFENFSIFLSYGYTNARFTEFVSGRNDYAGKFVPYAPQHTVSARAEYSLRINTRWLEHIVFGAGYRGTGRIFWDEENLLSQPYYSLLDGSVRFEQKHWSLELWGRNLTGTKYDVFRFASISHDFLQRGKPTILGATVNVNF